MQQSKAPKTLSSGMSDIPNLLSYPAVPFIEEVPELNERLVYIIEEYELNGFSMLLFFKDGKMGMRVGDWDGNLYDENKAQKVGAPYAVVLGALMEKARIPQAQFYFSGDKLVDIRTHLNKFVGPGMLRDLCGKVLPTQDIVDIQPLSKDVLAGINRCVILKHSSFKVIVRGNQMIPMYAIAGASDERKADLCAEKTA